MAGDWIKVEISTPEKPEVIAIAAALGIEQDAVVGKLIRFWSWCDANCKSGCAHGVTVSFVDRYCAQPGFGDAIVSVGWLRASDRGLTVPNFDRHNGQSGKTRALAARRMAKSRCASSATESQPEKRREEVTDHKDSSLKEHAGAGARENGQSAPADGYVQTIAESLLKRMAYQGDDDELPWRIAKLVAGGHLPENFARNGAEAVANATQPIANKIGYFRSCIEDQLAPGGPTKLANLLARHA